MNREEAQFILSAYRPGTADEHDPQFQEALALARQDPVLGRWLAGQQELDRAFAAKIRSQPVPPDLKAQLLLARTTGVHTPRWRRPAWIAAAASVAVLLAAGWGFSRRQDARRFASFRAAVEPAVRDMTTHNDVMGLDDHQLKTWLATHRGHADFVLPSRLAAQGIAGCKVLAWQGHRVTLLCFKVGGRHSDVFVVDAADLPGLRAGPVPLYAEHNGLTTALWRQGDRIYYLAGEIPRDDLERLL